MAKYRKKPVVISAEQWTGPECLGKIEGVREAFSSPVAESIIGPGPWYVIDTLEGTMRVHPGDWIITGIKGERYPCKPDIFEATYELVDMSAEHGFWHLCIVTAGGRIKGGALVQSGRHACWRCAACELVFKIPFDSIPVEPTVEVVSTYVDAEERTRLGGDVERVFDEEEAKALSKKWKVIP